MSNILSIENNSFVNGDTVIRLRGINLGNWMLIEHYMLGLPWTEHKIRSEFRRVLGERRYRLFFDAFMDCSVSGEDFDYLASCGFNLVRLSFNYRHFESDDAPGVYREEGFRLLDRAIGLAKARNMYVMPVVHAAPGSQARDWNAESSFGESLFWEHRDFQKRLCGLLAAIAGRYRDEPAVCGYVPLEEPVAADMEQFRAVCREMIAAIRGADKRHIIFLESNRWAKEIASLGDDLFDDPNVAPSVHHYFQQFPPFGALAEYPGTHEGKRYGREELLATLSGVVDTGRIKRPVMVGECGIHRGALASAQLPMLDDLLGYFNENGWSWSTWAYKDVGVMGLVAPRKDSAWQRFLSRDDIAGVRAAFNAAAHETHASLRKSHPTITGDAMDNLGREFVRDTHAVLLPFILGKLGDYGDGELISMAKSFAFGKCVPWKEMAEVMKKRAVG